MAFYDYQLPEITYNNDDGQEERITAAYNLPKGYDWRSELPVLGAPLDGLGFYSGYTFESRPGYDILKLHSTQSDSVDNGDSPSRENKKNNDSYWTYHLYLYERDIRLHPSYRTWWSYTLAAGPLASTSDISTAIAANGWAKTATDINLTAAQKSKFRWVENAAEIPEGWGSCLVRKYTAEAYKALTATAVRTFYYKSKKLADQVAVNFLPGTLAGPATTIPGCPSTATNWMIEDVNFGVDGKLFTLTIALQYNKEGYITEIYP